MEEAQRLALQETPSAELRTREEDEGEELAPPLLDLLSAIAESGEMRLEWEDVRALLCVRMRSVLRSMNVRFGDCPEGKGQHFEDVQAALLAGLGGMEEPPFTLQRLCEILMSPERHYKSVRKLMGALDKVINVSCHVPVDVPGPTSASEVVGEEGQEGERSESSGVGESVDLKASLSACESGPSVDRAEFAMQGSEISLMSGSCPPGESAEKKHDEQEAMSVDES